MPTWSTLPDDRRSHAARLARFLREHGPFDDVEDLLAAKLIKSPLEPWRTWFLAHGIDAPEPAEGSSFNDIGLMCDAAAQGLGIALVRLKLGQPWLDNGTLERAVRRATCPARTRITCAGAPAPWTAGNARRSRSG